MPEPDYGVRLRRINNSRLQAIVSSLETSDGTLVVTLWNMGAEQAQRLNDNDEISLYI